MTDAVLLSTLVPILLLLGLGVAAAILSRELGLSPIVGYIALGLAIGGTGMAPRIEAIGVLAELGVVFLLFDIGLHFSFRHLREHAGDVFGFGPVQVVVCGAGLGAVAWAAGLPPGPAVLLGATLALSSTAVVAGIIAERHQQNCPVGLTATAILIFQDVAAIFLLIVANALESRAALLPAVGLALAKAAGAFVVAAGVGRLLVRPFFHLVARTRNEEVFTATALLVALAAAWATGRIGLSLTLGAFLGGMTLSETPYRIIIQSEIKPFRGLLLGFFFVSVGLSLDLGALAGNWYWVLIAAAAIVAIKAGLNVVASLVFRWSVPGSTQLGLLLAQGSEFAFVLLSLPSVRDTLGPEVCEVLIAAVAVTLAVTPNLAELGRSWAGRLRTRLRRVVDPELAPQSLPGPVVLIGMGSAGRTIADALTEFEFDYTAIESDSRRLQEAIADGYTAIYGDLSEPRMWEPVMIASRRAVVITEPDLERAAEIAPIARERFPHLRNVVLVRDTAMIAPLAALGLEPVLEAGRPDGMDAARALLALLDVPTAKIGQWAAGQQSRARPRTDEIVTLA